METAINHVTEAPREQLSKRFVYSTIFERSASVQLTQLSSNISRLVPEDAEIFCKAFRQEELCYANSWLYVLRSTRDDRGGLGYKFVTNGTLMGIGCRDNTIYLVHPIGSGRFRDTLELCQKIHSSINCTIVLKKVDQSLHEYLLATGLFHVHASSLTLFEEEAFPEHILQLEKLYSPDFVTNRQSLPLLRKVKRFAKGSMRLLTATDISDLEHRPGFYELLGAHSDKYKSYREIICEVSSQRPGEGRYKVCLYRDEDEAIHGLYISELLAAGVMGLYCAVSSRSFPGITEWMDYDFFQQLFNDGIRSLYLGGSETEGVHAYVQKLLPINPSYIMRPMECIASTKNMMYGQYEERTL